MTTAEYFQTPETVLPRELAHGVLRVADSPTTAHQRVVRDLMLALAPFVRERQLGEVLCAPLDVVLDYDRDLVVQPDVVFVSHQRSHITTDRLHGPPDLVVEVLSPHPRIGVLDERVGWFARYGVREAWLASIPTKEIVVLMLKDGGVVSRRLFCQHEPVVSSLFDGLELRPLDVFGW